MSLQPNQSPTCLACGATFQQSYKFCPQCGAPGPVVCTRCNTPNTHDAKFCKECGSGLVAAPAGGPDAGAVEIARDLHAADIIKLVAPEGERRHVTIMLADISGYTAMSENLDPESVNEMLDRVKRLSAEVVRRHGGFINQFIGDEVVAVFGIGSSENTSQAAVQAAWDIRARIREFDPQSSALAAPGVAMHFAICSGLLVIRPAGGREGMFSLTGDPINTASRLAYKNFKPPFPRRASVLPSQEAVHDAVAGKDSPLSMTMRPPKSAGMA